MEASFPFATMTSLAGPFEGVDRQGHAFLIVRLGEVGKVPLCAFWTSRKGVFSPLLGDGWCLPFLESRAVPLEQSEIEFRQPDGFTRTLVRGRKDAKNLSSGLWRGREESPGDVRLSADFGSAGGKIEMAFRDGRLSTLRCAEGSFGFSYRGREIAKVTGDGGTLLTVERAAQNPDRVEFRFAGRASAVCERTGNTLAITAADGTRHAYKTGMDGEDATLDADGTLYRWQRYTGKLLSVGDSTYRIGTRDPGWNNAPIARTRDGRTEEYYFNRANGKGTYLTADGERYAWARFPSGELYGLMRWSEKTRGAELLHRHDYTYDAQRRTVFHRLRRGSGERENGTLPELEETWYAPDGKVTRVRIDGKEAKP